MQETVTEIRHLLPFLLQRLTLGALGLKLNDYWKEVTEKKAREREFQAIDKNEDESDDGWVLTVFFLTVIMQVVKIKYKKTMIQIILFSNSSTSSSFTIATTASTNCIAIIIWVCAKQDQLVFAAVLLALNLQTNWFKTAGRVKTLKVFVLPFIG